MTPEFHFFAPIEAQTDIPPIDGKATALPPASARETAVILMDAARQREWPAVVTGPLETSIVLGGRVYQRIGTRDGATPVFAHVADDTRPTFPLGAAPGSMRVAIEDASGRRGADVFPTADVVRPSLIIHGRVCDYVGTDGHLPLYRERAATPQEAKTDDAA